MVQLTNDMTFENLIDSYGYVAVLTGTVLEGETILLLGGLAARLGYLEFPWVIVCAFIGALTGDQLFFLLGRYHGPKILGKFPAWSRQADKAGRLLERQRVPIVLGFRFIYGIRSVTPFVIGMSRIPYLEFVVLNVIGAALWAIVIGTLGYVFGHGLELILGDIKRYEIAVFLFIMLAGILIWGIHIARTRRPRKPGRHAS
jgi:membrane protein DedA with SNARE-associated domain